MPQFFSMTFLYRLRGEKRWFWGVLAYLLFLLLSLSLLIVFLSSSHQRAWALAESRLAFSSSLIAEWITSSFVASDYLLRDMAAQIDPSELRYPHPDPDAQVELNERLEQRRQTFANAFLHGAFDRNCIVTHGNAVLGFDASHREYCTALKNNPSLNSIVTHGYHTNVGPVNVTQARALRSESGEFLGLVAIALDTHFFSQWLLKMGTGQVDTLAIVDFNQMLLARFPYLSAGIGQSVNSDAVRDFVTSKDRFRVVSMPSPLDGKPRYFGARKVAGLPFVIVVGIEKQSWLFDWNRLLAVGLSAWFLIVVLSFLALRNYLTLLDGRELLQRQAYTDPLTGVYNRHYFAENAEAVLETAQKQQGWFSLLVIDIDRFKQLNDVYGHLVGDKALQVFARCCQEQTHDDDLLIRSGGDEFMILTRQDFEGASELAHRIEVAVRTTELQDDQGAAILLSASIGVATKAPNETMSLTQMIHQADAAMYANKLARRQSD